MYSIAEELAIAHVKSCYDIGAYIKFNNKRHQEFYRMAGNFDSSKLGLYSMLAKLPYSVYEGCMTLSACKRAYDAENQLIKDRQACERNKAAAELKAQAMDTKAKNDLMNYDNWY